MKIVTGLTCIYVFLYVRTLWSHRTEESNNAHREHELADVDAVTEINSTIIPNTTNETSTTETEISNSSKKNDTVDTSSMEPESTFGYTSLNDSEYSTRLRFHQLSSFKQMLNDYNCPTKYGRFSVSDSCGGYIECQNGSAVSLECLGGLNFDAKSAKKTPCQYSNDVSCIEQQPTATRYFLRECPLKFGYFKIEDKYNCSSFRICEFGDAYDFECPNGLAFRSDNLRCDWPHKVPECDAEAYAGFRCPDKTKSFEVYRSLTDCQVYYTCIYGVPRRQSCGKYMGYDRESNICAPADRVKGCDVHLALLAKEDRRLKFIENQYSADYNDGDGYYESRIVGLSFSRRVRKPKIISFPFRY